MESSELIDLLERNGLSRIDARALSVFIDGRQRATIDIEREACLRQPEVSVAMSYLMGRGWFRQELIRKETGKGRPSIIYHLAKAFSEICNEIARERGTAIATMMNDLNALRAVA
jgi:predicted transcriptional regulator